MSRSQNGGEAVCAELERCGVKHVFGLPGTQNIDLFEALRRSRLRTILATSELAAAFMANGYYRGSGQVGVLTTIPGPGLAFTVAGIAEAALDSSALLYITGLPRLNRKFDLQAIDQSAIMSPLVKKIINVEDRRDLGPAIREGFRETTKGEPGPVLVQVSQELYLTEAALENEPDLRAPESSPEVIFSSKDRDDLVGLLCASQRVVLLVGQGVNDSAPRLVRLAELLHAPILATRSGRGVVPEDHPLARTYDVSERGLTEINQMLDQSDLILAIGSKLSHNGTYGFRLHLPETKLVHCDVSAEVLNQNYKARLALCLPSEALLAGLEAESDRLKSRVSAWGAEEKAGGSKPVTVPNTPEPKVQGVAPAEPSAFFAALRSAMPRDSCLVTDSGLHQVLATRYFRVFSARGLILPSDFQSMGFGLPAAIGAKLASPDRPVVALMGDGGLAMSAMELTTAVREKIPLTVIVFNDGALGQIRLQQLSSFGHSHATEISSPSLELLAAALGINYELVDGDATGVLSRAIWSNNVTLVEVVLGDGQQIRVERVKGLIRGITRSTLRTSLRRWIRSRLS